MSEPKTDKPAAAPGIRLPTGEPPPRSTAETGVGDRHGKLSRGVQHKLGETLQAMFDDFVKEGVPDRFAKLLEQIEENNPGAPAAEPDATQCAVGKHALLRNRRGQSG